MIVLHLAGGAVQKTHSQEGIGGFTKGFPVEEIAPTTDALTDQKAQCRNIQHRTQADLFNDAQ